MTKYYDKRSNRLVFIEKRANPDYWDGHWKKYEKLTYSKRISPFDFVVNTTVKYLPKQSLVLEGGCGLGQNVHKLNLKGYRCIGVDYAKETITFVKKKFPGLDIRMADVARLPFKKNNFDGYWSVGLIEHFYDGYAPVLDEMVRVIKPKGYLFLTFPHMSLLRRYKAKMGKYPLWKETPKLKKDFYQFALDENKVIKDLEKRGFILVKKKKLAGIKGFKDEILISKPILQRVYDSKNIFLKIFELVFSEITSYFTSHSILLVLRKK